MSQILLRIVLAAACAWPPFGSATFAGEARASGRTPNPPAAPEPSEARLEQVLTEWLQATKNRRRLDFRFKRYKYDYVFECEFRGEGTLAVDDEGRADYHVEPAAVARGAVSKKQNSKGSPFNLQSDTHEHWLWTGEEAIRVDDQARTVEIVRVAARSRPVPPELPSEAPQGSGEGGVPSRSPSAFEVIVGAVVVTAALFGAKWEFPRSFVEFIREFPWSRPCLVGMPQEALRREFEIKLLKETPTQVWLSFSPRSDSRREALGTATLLLNKEGWTPFALQWSDPSGNTETVHIFTDLRIDRTDRDADDLARPDLAGYRRLSN